MSSEGARAMSEEKNKKSALVPRLRFPEFQEAGEWTTPKLGSLGTFTGGGTPTKDNASYWGGSNPWVSSSDISEDNIHEIKISRFISDEAIQETATKVVPANSILLVSRVGVGKIAITREKICTSQDFTSFTPAKDNLVFLAYSLKAMKETFLSFNQGMAIKGFTKDDASNVKIPLPTKVREQQKIADCLSSLDELITAETQKLDALKTHKKGLMQQLFPAEGKTQPRLRFLEFQNAGEWEKSPLSNFILSLDAGVSVNAGDRPANKTEFGVLKTSAVTNGMFEPEESKVVLAESEQSRLKEPVCGGTIIICRKNTPALVGANVYVESSHENLFLSDLLWAAKPRRGVSMRFLAFILGSDKGRADLSQLASGSSVSMSNITKPDVLGLSVMAPSPPEQQKIADCLSSLDDLITAQSQKIDALKTHKKGLMQQLFPSPEEIE